MRIYHFTLIFAVFAFSMLVITQISLNASFERDMTGSEIGRALDRASEAAAAVLKAAGPDGITGVSDMAVDAFYSAFAADMGAAGISFETELLKLYVPVILVADEEHVYACYDEYAWGEDGREQLVRRWSGPVDRNASDIEECLTYYCSLHNINAERAGITWHFTVPEDDGGIFLRGSGGTGFFALFQGFPVLTSEGASCSLTSFAGTGISDAVRYFINIEGEGLASPKYWHREGCPFLSEDSEMFLSRKSCAERGAYECPECRAAAGE